MKRTVPDRQQAEHTITVRFGDSLLAEGFTAVPNLVLRHYAALGITEGEMLFTIHVWEFWWGSRNPYPTMALLAARMGKQVRQIQRYARALQDKGFLVVTPRHGGIAGQLANEFDYTPLLTALRNLADAGGVRNDTGGCHAGSGGDQIGHRGVSEPSPHIRRHNPIPKKDERGAPPANKYTTGRYAVCAGCGTRPCSCGAARG